MIVPAFVPGSLDNTILDLAWALPCYRSSLRRPNAEPAWLHEKADSFAERLVRKLERTCLLPWKQDLEACERYVPRN
jgi:hypothetical protein